MSKRRIVILILLLSALGTYEASQLGLLGPYGTPGDVYHQLILIFTATFTVIVALLFMEDEE